MKRRTHLRGQQGTDVATANGHAIRPFEIAVGDDPLHEVAKVKARFVRLRSSLVKEASQMESRLARVKAAIEEIDAMGPTTAFDPERGGADVVEREEVARGSVLEFDDDDAASDGRVSAELSNKSIPDVILAGVAAHPGGATAAQLRGFAQQSGKVFNYAHVPNYLFRLVKRGALRKKRGPEGMKYYLPTGATK